MRYLKKTCTFLLIFFIILGWVYAGFPHIELYRESPGQMTQTRVARVINTAEAATAGPTGAGIAQSGTYITCTDNMNWSVSASNLSANDTSYVSYTGNGWDSGDVTDIVEASNFGFSTTGTIDSISVEILGWTPAGNGNYQRVQLMTVPGATPTLVGTNKATGSLPTSDPGSTYQTFSGTQSSYWGTTLTPTEVNDAGFGVGLCWTTTTNNSTVNIDHVRITITYTPPSTFEQSAYRFFENADSTDVGTALATQDNPATLNATGDPFRLRLLIHIGTTQLNASGKNFKLQFAQQSGTCDTSFTGETYNDVTGATVIAYNNNTPADGATLTANANDPTHSGHTIVNQTYEEANNFTNSVAAIPAGQDGKWDFALFDNGATSSTAYCFRIVESDNTPLTTYTVIPQITTAAAANSAPTVASVSIDSGAGSVTLTEGTTKNVVCVGTVTDTNGYTDISATQGIFYRTSVGTSTADDANYKYTLYGDSECVPSGGSGNDETYTCTFAVQYYADPTDVGSPNASDTWSCEMWATDGTATSTNPGIDTIEMDSLFALSVTATINYGTLSPNTDTGATNQVVTVTNTGNRDMDPELSGTDMSSGGNSIGVAQQKYSDAAFTYSVGGSALSASPTTLNLTLPQQTSSAITDLIYWGIGVPLGKAAGTYTGTNTFTATTGI